MECIKIRDKLGFYLDGTLDEHTLEQMEAHLAQCEECRRELAAMKTLIDAAGEIETVEPPLGLRDRIIQAVTDENRADRAQAKVSSKLGLMGRLRSCVSPAWMRWAAGAAIAGCAALAILIGAPHEPAPKHIARQMPKPAQTISEKSQPQTKSTVVAESQYSEPAQVQSTEKPARRYTKKNGANKRRVIIADHPAKSLTSHAVQARLTIPTGKKDTEDKADTDAQDTEIAAAQTASAETSANAEPVNEQPIAIKVAAAPVFDNEKIQEMMQQAKMQAEMRKSRNSRAMVNIVSTRF
ncbi:zf-HC2 domain-containing protein [bacterium]|nr:zf-HC2 domain-containing protein [bacterium]